MTTAMITVESTENIMVVDSAASKIEGLMKDFLDYADVKPTTFATYQRSLKNFGKWIADNNISQLNRDVVIAYRDSILKSHAVTTCRLYTACVKLFVKFLASKGICDDFTAHVKAVKDMSDEHHRDALEVDEAREVFHSMQGDTEKALRDKAIVGLMLATGLRCVEVTRLDVKDIAKRGKKIFLTVWGKGRAGKNDSVILPAQCAALIKSYLAKRGNVKPDAPLFVSTSHRCKNDRLQPQTISRLCKKALVNAGFNSSRLTAHSLRHSFASIALDDDGKNLREVSKNLRHKSQAVTEIYLHDKAAKASRVTQKVADLIF